MFILFGDNLTPVAVFDTNELLANYVNSLVVFGTSQVDPVLKEQSVLKGHKDHQSISVGQLWEAHADWESKLVAAKGLPKNPTCMPKSEAALLSEKAELLKKQTDTTAEMAKIDALISAKTK